MSKYLIVLINCNCSSFFRKISQYCIVNISIFNEISTYLYVCVITGKTNPFSDIHVIPLVEVVE